MQTVGSRVKEEAKMMKGDDFLKQSEEAGLQKQLITEHDLCPRLNFNSGHLKMVWKHLEKEVVVTRSEGRFIKI